MPLVHARENTLGTDDTALPGQNKDENGIWIENALFDGRNRRYLYSVLKKEADSNPVLQTPDNEHHTRLAYRKHLETIVVVSVLVVEDSVALQSEGICWD